LSVQNPAVLYPEVWKKEYTGLKILPSSYRAEPSHALTRAQQILGPFSGYEILDVGYGNGRNALAMASQNRVHAIDFCPEALAMLKRRVFLCQPPINLSYELWNALIPNQAFQERFDIILDAYFSCHIVDEAIFKIWSSNAQAYLRVGGVLLVFGFTIDDSYYAQCDITKSGGFVISKDTTTGIDKRLDSPEFMESYFNDCYTIYSERVRFPDLVLGKPYDRDILLSVLRLKPDVI
jgi:SAM-dependent methyltransferase